MSADANPSGLNSETKPSRLPRRTRRLLVVGVLLVLGTLILWRPLQQRWLFFLLTRSQAPSPAVLQEVVEHTSHPQAMLKALWNTKRIPHRQFVLNFLRLHLLDHPQETMRDMEPLVVQAAGDADVETRELAFNLLARMKHPELKNLASEQLGDPDPALRVLGLQTLRGLATSNEVPIAIKRLGDTDPRVIVAAADLLRHVTGQDFGIRQTHALPRFFGAGLRTPSAAALESIRQGVERWQQWWAAHQEAFQPSPVSARSPTRTEGLPFPDLVLQDSSGRPVRLSALGGKPMLLSIWDPTNSISLADLPALKSLQERHGKTLTVLVVCFAAPLPEGCGHEANPGHCATASTPRLADVRALIRGVVDREKVNFPVLLDIDQVLAGRLVVQEMPTYVLLDAQGNVRRRFVGSRTEGVFEAMLRELTEELPAPQKAP